MRVLVRARPQTHGAHLSIDSRYNEGYIATLERAVRGGRLSQFGIDLIGV